MFAGGEDIQEDPENLLQTNLEIMPPGTTTFFPFPVLLTVSTALVNSPVIRAGHLCNLLTLGCHFVCTSMAVC